MKGRIKQKANNTIVELVTSQFKEFNTSNSDVSQMFKDLIIVVSEKTKTAKEVVNIRNEERAHKLMLKEPKMRAHKDKIMMLDTLIITKMPLIMS